MPRIHIKYIGSIYFMTHVKEENIETSSRTLEELIDEIVRRHPETRKVLSKIKNARSVSPIMITMEGKLVPLEKVGDVELENNAEVAFIPPVPGG